MLAVRPWDDKQEIDVFFVARIFSCLFQTHSQSYFTRRCIERIVTREMMTHRWLVFLVTVLRFLFFLLFCFPSILSVRHGSIVNVLLA
jgi:hypothetical protein